MVITEGTKNVIQSTGRLLYTHLHVELYSQQPPGLNVYKYRMTVNRKFEKQTKKLACVCSFGCRCKAIDYAMYVSLVVQEIKQRMPESWKLYN